MNSLREENITLLYAIAYNADFLMRFVDFFTKGMKWIDQIEKLKKKECAAKECAALKKRRVKY